MTDFGYQLENFRNNPDETAKILSVHLNAGALGLFLGSGASSGFGMPGWQDLVIGCMKKVDSKFTPLCSYSNADLKKIMDEVKSKAGVDYIKLIREELYKNANFDFLTVSNKDLLIAISALVVGKARGRVKNIVTYNFDDVLEWYLNILGLTTSNISPKTLIKTKNSDIDVTHIHGFIPNDKKFGIGSDKIIFSKMEFEDRQIQDSYWKDHLYDFFRKNIVVTIGISPGSLEDDIFPLLRNLNKWYLNESLLRGYPYAVALMTPSDEAAAISPKCITHGVIPIILKISEIPATLFKIAQFAI